MTPAAAGTYTYTDQPGHVEVLHVVDDEGTLCARFEDEDGHELIPIADMAGDFAPA